jgi:hypothetical protein
MIIIFGGAKYRWAAVKKTILELLEIPAWQTTSSEQ